MTMVQLAASAIKIWATLCLWCLALVACSCGSPQTDSSTTGIATHMGMLVYPATGRAVQLTYGVVVQNQRSDQLARNVRVDATFVSAQGAALSSLSRTIPGIPAGERTAIGESDSAARIGSGDATTAASIRISVHVGSWQAQPKDLGSLQVSAWEEGPTDAWTELISVNSSFSRTVWNVTFVAIYADSQGKIVGGSSGCKAEVTYGPNTGETAAIEPIPGATQVGGFVQWKEPNDEGPLSSCE
jgi:hypothetical protein